MDTFQKRVTLVTGYERQVSTVSIWGKEKDDDVRHPKAEVVGSSHILFLDMKMTWTAEEKLRFGVYLKPNQELKYHNNDSLHPHHCFKAITKGVFGCLASLTSLMDESKYKFIKDIYPQHHEALNLAGL
jgi:hypothetical protein